MATTTTTSSTPSDTIDQVALEKAATLKVWSETGEAVTFGSLFAQQKTIVVFIRESLFRRLGGILLGTNDVIGPFQAISYVG
jgi:hypothetical protein